MNPEDEFFYSLAKNEYSQDFLKELAEVGVDALLTKDGVLKDIPILGTAISLIKAGQDISAYFFTKRILSFLKEVSSIPFAEKEKFLKDKDAKKISEALIMILDKQDDYRLSELLGKAFKAYLLELIDRGQFDQYVHIIRNLSVFLLDSFSRLYSKEDYRWFLDQIRATDIAVVSSLTLLGLIEQVHSVEADRFTATLNVGSNRHQSERGLINEVLKRTKFNYKAVYRQSKLGLNFYNLFVLDR